MKTFRTLGIAAITLLTLMGRVFSGAIDRKYAELERQLASDGVDSTDGARLHWAERRAWLHLRPSGTEPVVRLIAEAPERSEAEELIERATAVLEGIA